MPEASGTEVVARDGSIEARTKQAFKSWVEGKGVKLDDSAPLVIVESIGEDGVVKLMKDSWRTSPAGCFEQKLDSNGPDLWREVLVWTDGATIDGKGAELGQVVSRSCYRCCL